MTAPVIAAIITGTVALLAIASSLATTWLNLCHQRQAEGQRREHERHMRLLDSALMAGVEFLVRADETTRAQQALQMATSSLQGAKSQGNEEFYKQTLASYTEIRQKAIAAWTRSETAYAAVRMLIPSASDQARQYLDLCEKADFPDARKDDREQLRKNVEEILRQAFEHG